MFLARFVPPAISLENRFAWLDPRDHLNQRVAVIGIARQRLYMGDELAALAVLEGGGNADLDAELVRLVGLTLADALHFGVCVPKTISEFIR